MSNYSRFSPIAKLIEQDKWPVHPRGSEKLHKFWEAEKQIFREGFTVGGERITGAHYWQLNYCHMGITNDRGNKVPTLPYYFDWLKEFYDTVEDCYKTEENILGLKGRDKGWTYAVAALALFNMMNEDFSEVMGLFPGGTSTAKTNYRKAYDMAYNELDTDLKHPSIKDAGSSKYLEEIKYAFEVAEKGTDGKPTGIKKIMGPQTKLTLITAVNSGVVRSGRSKLLFIEEMGEMEGSKELIGVADANMREGGKKFGILIAGGTSNCFNKGFQDFRDLWHDPKQFNFRKIWIPANKSYLPFVNLQTGESDLEGAKEHRMVIRANKKGKDLVVEKQEYPFTEEEAFYQGGLDSPYDSDKCNEQIARILSDNKVKNAIQRGMFHVERGDKGKLGVKWEITDNGWWQIFEHPKKLITPYVGAVDSYRLAESQTDSEGAIEIYVPFQGVNKPGNYPAAIFRGRDKDKDVFFMQCVLASIYWDCKMLIEYTDEDIMKFFLTHAQQHHLKERPTLLKTYVENVNRYGVHPTPQARNMATEYAVKDFNMNYQQIVFTDLLDEMIKFGPKVNTDRVWAHHWAVLHAMDEMKVLEEFKKPKKERTFAPFTATSPDGRLIVVETMEQAKRLGLHL